MIHILETVSSTNHWLSEYSGNIGDILVSRNQTAGRGRLGNFWESSLGGLYFSFTSNNHKLLPLIVGTSVAITMQNFVKKISLKWPNDIIFHGKKLGGILCENLGHYSVSGVGLNITNKVLSPNSITLTSKGVKFSYSFFMSSFLSNFEKLFVESSDEIISNFEHFDTLIGQEVFWETNQGVAQSIAEDGSLVVQTSNQIFNLHAEEVHLEKK